MKKQLGAVLAAFLMVSANAQTIDLQKIKDYLPQVHGTIRGESTNIRLRTLPNAFKCAMPV